VVLLWSGLIACIRLPDVSAYRRVAATSAWVLVLAIWINIAAANVEGLGKLLGVAPGRPSDPGVVMSTASSSEGRSTVQPAVAEGLRQLGVDPGERVGYIGYSFTAFWAHLARVQIIAELEPQHAVRFWTSNDARQAVLRAFATTGATAVVAEPVRGASIPDGWSRIGETGYLVHFLR
jgi:hypothetical protein